jgi:hypothetical protein
MIKKIRIEKNIQNLVLRFLRFLHIRESNLYKMRNTGYILSNTALNCSSRGPDVTEKASLPLSEAIRCISPYICLFTPLRVLNSSMGTPKALSLRVPTFWPSQNCSDICIAWVTKARPVKSGRNARPEVS